MWTEGSDRHEPALQEKGAAHLHAQADAEVGDIVLARVLRCKDLALHSARAKAARHQNAVRRVYPAPRLCMLRAVTLLRQGNRSLDYIFFFTHWALINSLTLCSVPGCAGLNPAQNMQFLQL